MPSRPAKQSEGYRASRRTYLTTLCVLFAVLWIPLAFHPHDRSDWLLENALLVVGIVVLALSYRRLPLSKISYTAIFVFCCLHAIGAHYTYAEVPYDAAIQAFTGHTLQETFGWQRNHFDRLVHFSYGLLLAYPIRELFLRVANVRGFWGYFLPLDLTMSTSMLYELIEWGAAVFFGGDLGTAYLGSQGDVWDAQKDMALATVGAVISMCITAAVNVRLQKDFARDWVESLRVKDVRPLGEEAIHRMRAH
jgi:putative membrane protein